MFLARRDTPAFLSLAPDRQCAMPPLRNPVARTEWHHPPWRLLGLSRKHPSHRSADDDRPAFLRFVLLAPHQGTPPYILAQSPDRDLCGTASGSAKDRSHETPSEVSGRSRIPRYK